MFVPPDTDSFWSRRFAWSNFTLLRAFRGAAACTEYNPGVTDDADSFHVRHIALYTCNEVVMRKARQSGRLVE